MRYRLHDEDFDRDGVVKKVGKKHTRNQDICWIERTDDGSKHLIAVDFMKDVEAWDYIKNSKVVFEESSDKNDAEKGKPLAEDESVGIFYLQRREPVEILATLVQSKDYGHPDIQDAMADELKKWRSYGAYEEVLDEEQTRINTRWVVNRKDIHDGLKVDVKARLCLRGFQELEKPRSDSPTVDRTSTRLLYAVAANENWPVVAIDVTSAFLQGEDLDRSIFVTPPTEANCPEGYIWKMIKPAYGLYDASRKWWMKVAQELVNAGCKSLVGDEALFYYHKDGKLQGIISLHVDDFQGAGTEVFQNDIMDRLENAFKISKKEIKDFKYTGVQIHQEDNGEVILSQKEYLASIEAIPVDPKAENEAKLNKPQFKEFRAASGKITWLAEQTRPDLAYDVIDMTSHNKDASIKDIKDMNKVIKKAKEHDTIVKFSRIGDFKDMKILAIADGAYCKKEQKTKSVMGRFIFLTNTEESKVVPIIWKAKTIPTVCKSAKAAETRSVDKAIEDAVYVARCVREVYTGDRGEAQIDVEVVTDSQPLLDSIESTRQIDDKLLRPTIKSMKQMLDAKMIKRIRWCDTDVMVADILTKAGAPLTEVVRNIMETNQMIDLYHSKKRPNVHMKEV